MEKAEIKSRWEQLKVWAGPIFVLVMLIAALWFLHLELKKYSLEEFKNGLLAIPGWKLFLAVLFTLLNYAILVCYDWLGIWYIRHPMKFGRVALASFLGYSVGNNFGLLFGGSTIRYRLYSTWGLSAAEIVTLLFILAITFWIGLFALSGLVFLIFPLEIPDAINLPMSNTRPLGILLTTLAVGYLLASFFGKPIRIGKKEFRPPPFGLSLAQYFVAAVDLLVAAAIVYVLLPESIEISYFKFVGIFLLAQVAVFVTQVPGGLGVLELCLITLLAPSAAAKPELFAALMAYRLIFYLTPMVIGIGMLGAHEVIMHRANLKKLFGALGVWTPDIAPRFIALVVFFTGVCILFASALPVEDFRIDRLATVIPATLIEINYTMGGIFGVLLLLLASGLYQRMEIAWRLTLPTLVASTFFALFGSLGYWQAVMLVVAFCVVAPTRHYFYRRGKFLTERLAWHWLIAISIVLILAFWLYWFAAKERNDFSLAFWSVGLHVDAPRSLRAILAAFLVLMVFCVIRLSKLRFDPTITTSHADLQIAKKIVEVADRPSAVLALQGDKRFLFNKEQTALVTFASHHKSCVALGNPIGETEAAFQIAWDFKEMCQQQSLWPVFFLVDNRFAALYQEMNLKLFHVGDQALVDLHQVDAVPQVGSPLHDSWESVKDSGYEFNIVQGEELQALLPVLERIDQEWQSGRGGLPLKFSIGRFNHESLLHGPVGLVKKADQIEGFLTLWLGVAQDEFAVGLARYTSETPAEILDFMLIEAIRWGQSEQYRFLDLGEAPMADWHSAEHIEMRSQLMSLAFRFGKHFYSYQGVRNYKDRFSPVWNPIYVASPADRPLDTVLSDIAQIIGSSDIEPKSKLLK